MQNTEIVEDLENKTLPNDNLQKCEICGEEFKVPTYSKLLGAKNYAICKKCRNSNLSENEILVEKQNTFMQDNDYDWELEFCGDEIFLSRLIHKYEYRDENFDNKWELALWIYAQEHNEEIKRCSQVIKFTFEGEEYSYRPDFEYQGKLIRTRPDLFYNENDNFFDPCSPNVDEFYKCRQEFLESVGVQAWKRKDLDKYVDYVNEKYTKDFLELFRRDLPFPFPKLTPKARDIDIVRCFHRSIYLANRDHFISPYQAWQDKRRVEFTAKNRLKYVQRCDPYAIIQGFNVAKVAPKVSVFKPSLATALLKEFSHYNNVFDPFSGFSGRLIGACKLGKSYIGQDLNKEHVKESNNIIKFLGLKNCSVVVQDLFKDENREFPNTTLLTCPPYGSKEQWGDKDEVFLSCDEWIKLCLEKYKCNEYIFVVDRTENYKDKIVKTITNKSHFGKNNEYVLYFKEQI